MPTYKPVFLVTFTNMTAYETFQVSDGAGEYETFQVSDGAGGYEDFQVLSSAGSYLAAVELTATRDLYLEFTLAGMDSTPFTLEDGTEIVYE